MFNFDHRDPRNYFALGLALIMVCLAVPVIPNWRTFIHMWQVELVASVFLVGSLSYVAYHALFGKHGFSIHRREFLLIVLPLVIFIAWSAISISWAPSWKSAVHHTLVWCEYLTFYLLARSVVVSKDYYRRTLTIVTAAFVLVSLPAIVEYVSLLIFGGGSSIGLKYARYGEQVNTLVPLVVAGILSLKGRQFRVGIAAVVALWLLIFISLGRTNIALFFVATLSVVGCVFAFKRFHEHRTRAIVLILVLIAVPFPLHVFSLFSSNPNVPVLRRVNDEAAIGSSNGFRKLMTSISLEMFRRHPITGVGADNFGMQLNDHRADYGLRNSTDSYLVNAENEIPERSHNEYLQILAELGLVGGLIFAWFLAGIGVIVVTALRKRDSLTALAAATGLVVFLVSSLVTSYSFRLIQNGFVFFFVLAVGANLLLKRRNEEGDDRIVFSPRQIRAACLVGLLCCLSLITYNTVRVASVIYATRADKIASLDEAIPLYERAISLDNENPDAEFSLGFRLMDAKQYKEASRHLESSIKIGRGPSVSYSYLATAYLMDGDAGAAAQSFSNAVAMYPLSTFVRARHAFLLEKAGESEKAAVEREHAHRISAADTATWLTLMNDGAGKATENANQDKSISPIMDLTPTVAIYAILFERVIEHPEEKSTLDFMK